MALVIVRKESRGCGQGSDGCDRWIVVEGVAGVVEEEERVVGLVIAKPRSDYLDPSAPCTSPPMHRHLVLVITLLVSCM